MFLAILILKLQVKIIQTIQKSNKSCIMPWYFLFTYMTCRLFEFIHVPPVAWAWADIATEAVIAAWWLLDSSTANLSLRSLICCIWLLRWASIWLICLNKTNSDENIAAVIVGNKAKERISKRVFQENKARQIFEKRTFLTPRYADVRTCAYQGVRNGRFSENWRVLFSWNSRFEIHRIELYIKQETKVNKKDTPKKSQRAKMRNFLWFPVL